jgi:hypothetical protein
MMSHRSDQHSLFAADTQYLEFVGEESCYGFVAQHGRELFPDEAFAQLYCPDLGRPSVPPSMLAIALLPQPHERVSDQEPTERGCRTRKGTAEDGMPSVSSIAIGWWWSIASRDWCSLGFGRAAFPAGPRRAFSS